MSAVNLLLLKVNSVYGDPILSFNTLGLLLVLVGIMGLFWSLGGAPLAALALRRLRTRQRVKVAESATATDYQVLIPAHNEEQTIGQTLRSLEVGTSVLLGLDHCTDQTESVARVAAADQGLKLEVVSNSGPAGKWHMLTSLIRQSSATWIALVDCGAVWNSGLPRELKRAMQEPGVVGVAPSYHPSESGKWESLLWRVEQQLKAWESSAGGPTSVHGATVVYRKDRALEALEGLEGDSTSESPTLWLNDDVVIPLWIRLEHPEERITYLASPQGGWVTDSGIKAGQTAVEFRRRLRMAMGNLQWIEGLWLPRWKTNAEVSLISSRRIARTLWAYWVFCAGLGFAVLSASLLHTGFYSVQQSFGAVMMVVSIGFWLAWRRYEFFRRLSVAWLSAVLAPLTLGRERGGSSSRGGVQWT